MVIVFGSINLDLVVSVPRLPGAGETVAGPDYQTFPGGKGANQALAARCAGAEVKMVCAVGTDEFADKAQENLRKTGVDLSSVKVVSGATGIAMIGVDHKGENQILVASGSNAKVEARWLDGLLSSSDTVLMQMEIPESEVRAAIAVARNAGARVALNTAPSGGAATASLARDVDVIIANETEAAELAGPLGCPAEPEAFAAAMADKGKLVVVTLGADGAIAHDGEKLHRIRPLPVEVKDTTGAGDAFCGALVAALDANRDIARALAEATAAGTLACLATGAQSSAPQAADIQAMADKVLAAQGS